LTVNYLSMVTVEVECEKCGELQSFDWDKDKDRDWVKLVCSECGEIQDLSVVNLLQRVNDE